LHAPSERVAAEGQKRSPWRWSGTFGARGRRHSGAAGIAMWRPGAFVVEPETRERMWNRYVINRLTPASHS